MHRDIDAPTARTRPKLTRRGKAAVAVAVTAAILGAGAAAVAAGVNGVTRAVRSTEIPESAFGAARDGKGLNILVVGTDTRDGQGRGYGSSESTASGFGHSDTTILLHVNEARSAAFAVSIPRDSWIERPTCEPDGGTDGRLTWSRFNTAFSIGGPACTLRALRHAAGLPRIDHVVSIDFRGFLDVVDVLGGVPVCSNKPLKDPVVRGSDGSWHGSGLDIPAGRTVLDSKQALAYVRARYLDPTADVGRMKRQQAFLASVVRALTDKSNLLHPIRTHQTLTTVAGAITVDSRLKDDLLSVAWDLHRINPSKIRFVTVPANTRSDGATLAWDQAKAGPIWKAVRNDTGLPSKPRTASPVRTTTGDGTGRAASDSSCL